MARLRDRQAVGRNAATQRAARDLEDEGDESIRRGGDFGSGDAALEAMARVAADRVATARGTHRDRIEGRCLDEDRGGLVGDRGLGAALDARERHRALRVGDDEVLGSKSDRRGAFAERQERFALLGETDLDAPAAELREIEDVGRLAELEEDEVGRVDEVVAGDLPDRFEPPPKPLGARTDLDAVDDAAGVERATFRRVVDDLDRAGTLDGARLRGGGRPLHAPTGDCGDLAGEREMGEAVAAIGGGLDLEPGFAVLGDALVVDRESDRGEDLALLLGRGGRIEVVVDPGDAGFHDREKVPAGRGGGGRSRRATLDPNPRRAVSDRQTRTGSHGSTEFAVSSGRWSR